MFDVLRVLAMLFIVLHHLTINNIGLSSIETYIDPALVPQYLGTSFLDCFFIIGVHSFAVYILHCNNPLLSQYRAFFINLFTQEQLYAKFLVLIPNAVVIFLMAVAIGAIYDLTVGKAADKLCAVLDRGIVSLYRKIRDKFLKNVPNGAEGE